MIRRILAIGALLNFALALPAVSAQAVRPSASAPRASSAAPARSPAAAPDSAAGLRTSSPAAPLPTAPAASAAPPGAAAPGTGENCAGAGCDLQTPRISIAMPAPAPAPWPWQQRVAWGANLILVLLGYIAIMMALSLLRKIERQTEYVETAAQAAADTAHAALAQAQAMVRAERPWILMTVRPAQNIENGFAIVATNRGRGPALILSTVDEIVSAVDEGHLAPEPEFRNEPVAPADPLILLPGETTELLSFSRADVKRVCESEERLARVEKWEEKVFLYGKVVYCDLTAPDHAPAHESSW
ncbi:MAG: hypothetical protein ACLGSH_04400, partial [Acidobacteriota bacterium]